MGVVVGKKPGKIKLKRTEERQKTKHWRLQNKILKKNIAIDIITVLELKCKLKLRERKNEKWSNNKNSQTTKKRSKIK